MEGYQRSKR